MSNRLKVTLKLAGIKAKEYHLWILKVQANRRLRLILTMSIWGGARLEYPRRRGGAGTIPDQSEKDAAPPRKTITRFMAMGPPGVMPGVWRHTLTLIA